MPSFAQASGARTQLSQSESAGCNGASLPAAPLLSVVMPAYNERHTIEEVVSRVLALPLALELIVVDDASTDGSPMLLEDFAKTPGVCLVRHAINRGKGAALRTGFAAARGQIVIVQDADLEYDPSDYPSLIEPIVAGEADLVLGSRFLDRANRQMPLLTRWANRLITAAFNRALGLRLTDIETCYKAFRRETLHEILPLLKEDRFGIEIELVARATKIPGVRLAERPIRYKPRTRQDGKKIGWRDGLEALRCIRRYG